VIDLILDIRADYTESSTKPWMEVSIEILDPSRLKDFFTAGRHHKRPTPAGPITSLQAVSAITRRLQPRRRKIGKIMDNNTVLSLSSDQAILTSREIALRSGGLKVVSVMSPIQARFEIEMGMCGIFPACIGYQKWLWMI